MKTFFLTTFFMLGAISFSQAQKKIVKPPVDTKKATMLKFKIDNILAAELRKMTSPYLTQTENGVKTFKRISQYNEPNKVPKFTNELKLDQNKSTETCKTYTTSIGESDQEFNVPYGLASSHLIPGRAFMKNEYLKNSVSPKYITDWPRNPIQLVIDAGEANPVLVDNPTYENLDIAIKKLKKGLPKNSYPVASAQQNMYITYTNKDFALAVGAGGCGYGFKVDAKFGMENSSRQTKFVIDEVQEAYTINAMPQEGVGKQSFFKDANLDKNPDVIFLSSITYGLRILAVVEVENTKKNMTMMANASYSGIGWGVNVNMNILDKMEKGSVKVRVYYVGTNGPNTIDITNFDEPNKMMSRVIKEINNAKRKAQLAEAKPVKFNFRDMSMTPMKYETATDKFSYEICEQGLTLKSVNAIFETGNDDKNKESEVWISLGSGGQYNTKWFTQIYDNSRKFNKQSNPWNLEFKPLSRVVKGKELMENGGFLAFKLIGHGGSGKDEWEFSNFSLKFNFVNDDGVNVTKYLNYTKGFTIKNTSDSKQDSYWKQFDFGDFEDELKTPNTK